MCCYFEESKTIDISSIEENINNTSTNIKFKN